MTTSETPSRHINLWRKVKVNRPGFTGEGLVQ